MLKRNPAPTAQESRARRIRAAFLSCFAVFLSIILLGLSWFVGAFHRINPPWSMVPEEEPHGVLTFRLEFLADGAAVALGEDDPEAAAGFKSEFKKLSSVLANDGQLFVWADGDQIREWIAFVPIRKANRYSMNRLRTQMEQSSLFVPSATQAGDDPNIVGYYRLDSKGIVLSSKPETVPFILEKAMINNDGEAIYRSADGFSFPRWRPYVGALEFDRLEWKGKELNALKEGHPPKTVSYFHPLFGSPESGK